MKMKKGWKTHFVLTIAQSYLFVQASFFSGPDLVSSQPVMTRKELGKEANEKEGGTLSQAFQVGHADVLRRATPLRAASNALLAIVVAVYILIMCAVAS